MVKNNAHNGNGGGNIRYNSGNLGDSTRRCGAFSYMTKFMVATTNVHDMNHVPNPIEPDTMARIESDHHADNICAGKNMKLFQTLVNNETLTDSILTQNQWTRFQ